MRSLLIPTLLFTTVLAACDGDKTPSGDSVGPGDSGAESSCVDSDGDGYDSCEDCDDTNAMINPGADEECDGVDNDCDGELDEDVQGSYYADTDGDGFGDSANSTLACEASDGWVPVDGDCDDADPYVYPNAEEICDGVDNDCNDTIDDGLESETYYADSDGDSLGNPDETIDACDQPTGYVDNMDDCDDTDALEPVYADSVAGSAGGTGTMTNPLDSLQAAIDQANVCVYAMPGTYNENIDFGGKDILVKGVDGMDATFIVGSGDDSVVTFENGESADAMLTGFTIMGGGGKSEVTTSSTGGGSSSEMTTTTYRYYGGGVYTNGASPTLYDLKIADNTLPGYSYSNPSETEEEYVYSYGGGVFFGDSVPDIWSVWLVDNYSDVGGGAYVSSSSTVDARYLWVDGNWASSGGGLTSAGSTTLSNSILIDNGSSGTGSAVGGAGADVDGGSIALNYVDMCSNEGVASLYLKSGGSATVWNTILFDNDTGYMVDGEAGTSLAQTYSLVYGGGSGEYGASYTDPTGSYGNLSADPYFSAWSDDDDSSGDDMTLSSRSSAVDAGDPAEADADGSSADMGAYGGPEGVW